MSEDTVREEIIDRCIERLLAGEPVADVLAAYPGVGSELLPLLEAAGALTGLPAPDPRPAARGLAMSRMFAQVSAEARRPRPAGVLAWLGTLRARPLAFQAAALAGAVVVFAGLGIGASAATGTAPEPVRTFFRLPDDSPKSVRLSGTLVSASGQALVIETDAGERTVGVDGATVFRRGGAPITWMDLRAGERIDMSGTERDGRLTARRVDASPSAEPPATEQAAPSTQPAGDETRGPDDDRGTETPSGGRTPDDRPGDDGPREPTKASATPAPGEGGDHDRTPEATKTRHDEDRRTPEATRSPDGGDDHTPSATESPSSGSGDDH